MQEEASTMLKLIDISLTLGNFNLGPINLSVNQNEYLIVIGRTGSGKTTLLKTIAGAYSATGKIILGDEDITAEPPERRSIGYVSQSFISFDNLNVNGNIEFGLRVRNIPKEERAKLARQIASELGIESLGNRSAGTLSGGEQQRVSLARALVTHPKVLLLDEPLSMLDPETKRTIIRVFKRIPEKYNVPVIHVTHEWDEAYTLADKMAVMHDGKIIEVGVPEKIFEEPENYHTATLVGFENIFKGNASPNESGSKLQLENGLQLMSSKSYSGPVYVCIRPERIRIGTNQYSNDLTGKVEEVFRERSGYRIIASINDVEITAITKNKLVKGEVVAIAISKDSVHLIPIK
jgi:molybdate/tungstate transport system ATP-binding protein